MENDRQRIWWIASYPKSGSTWVRMFVNAYVTGWPTNINSAWQYATGDLQPQLYQLTSAQPVTDMIDVDCFYYRPAVLLNHVATSHTKDCALKTHNAKVEVDGMPMIPPKLSKGALYIVRDPRDVAVSFAHHLGVKVDEAIEKMAHEGQMLEKQPYKLFHILSSWSMHVNSWTTANKDVRTGVVRYEDLLADPAKWFRSVLAALGIDADDEERFQFALEQTKFENLQSLEGDTGFQENGKGDKFFRRGEAGGWRDALTRKQVRRIEKAHAKTMQRWGYDLYELSETRANVLGRLETAAVGSVQ